MGESIGARLIAHAGSLTNLAKYPASTVQILGAEKALFRFVFLHRGQRLATIIVWLLHSPKKILELLRRKETLPSTVLSSTHHTSERQTQRTRWVSEQEVILIISWFWMWIRSINREESLVISPTRPPSPHVLMPSLKDQEPPCLVPSSKNKSKKDLSSTIPETHLARTSVCPFLI